MVHSGIETRGIPCRIRNCWEGVEYILQNGRFGCIYVSFVHYIICEKSLADRTFGNWLLRQRAPGMLKEVGHRPNWQEM